MLEKITEECVQWERHYAGAWEENKEKEVKETVKWTNDSPYSLTLFIIWGKKGKNLGVMLSLEKREGDGGAVFKV